MWHDLRLCQVPCSWNLLSSHCLHCNKTHRQLSWNMGPYWTIGNNQIQGIHGFRHRVAVIESDIGRLNLITWFGLAHGVLSLAVGVEMIVWVIIKKAPTEREWLDLSANAGASAHVNRHRHRRRCDDDIRGISGIDEMRLELNPSQQPRGPCSPLVFKVYEIEGFRREYPSALNTWLTPPICRMRIMHGEVLTSDSRITNCITTKWASNSGNYLGDPSAILRPRPPYYSWDIGFKHPCDPVHHVGYLSFNTTNFICHITPLKVHQHLLSCDIGTSAKIQFIDAQTPIWIDVNGIQQSLPHRVRNSKFAQPQPGM